MAGVQSNVRKQARRKAGVGRDTPLRDQAFEKIRKRIICLDYAPGQYLSEAQVSKELGLGRTPVRQAFDRLMLMNMISILPRKGVMVSPISLDEIDQIIEVRLVNETHCTALAAERATAEDIEEMEDILAEAEIASEARDRERLMELDKEFHRIIARAARNKVLGDLLANLHDRSLRFWFISLGDEAHLKCVGAEHKAIYEKIRDRDPEAAATAAREHIASFRANIMKSI